MESFAFQFIISTTLVLIVITLYLFSSSVLVRNAHRREEHYFNEKREELYPYILDYMIGETDELSQLEVLVATQSDIHPLLTILYEIVDSVEGDEVQRLRDILGLSRVRSHAYKLLRSRSETDHTQACAYYARLGSFTDEEFVYFKRFLHNEKLLIAHTAATAIMHVEDVDRRYLALTAIVRRQRVSRMAVLDLIYQFHNRINDQMDEEAEKLLDLIRNRALPTDNVSVVIKAICEIGYVTIAMDIFELLESGYWDRSAMVTESLLYAMGRFELGFAADTIRERYIHDRRPNVRRTAVETLERFGDDELIDVFEQTARDPEFVVRLKSIYALAGFGEKAADILENLARETDEMRQLIRGVVAEVKN